MTGGVAASGVSAQGRLLAALSLWLLPATVLTLPVNLLPFGLLLVLTSVPVLPGLLRIWPTLGLARGWLLACGPAVVVLAGLSALWHQQPASVLDNLSRLLLIPWVACWVRFWGLNAVGLYRGALVGLAGTVLLAGWQFVHLDERPPGWSNAIVLADGAVVLLALVAGLVPAAQRWRWLLPSGVATVAILVLTGSRGAWPALIVPVLLIAQTGHARFRRLWPAGLLLLALAGALLGSSASVREQVRVHELASDLSRLAQGDADSSLGARLRLWQAGLATAVQAPWDGVGPGGFRREVAAALPECQPGRAGGQVCGLGHAHNDMFHWLASGGVPGGLALLLVYGVPLWLFRGASRFPGQSGPARRAAFTGMGVVLVHVLCGLTQSMFSHQLTAGLYASLVGVLLGLAWPPGRARDQPAADRAPAATA